MEEAGSLEIYERIEVQVQVQRQSGDEPERTNVSDEAQKKSLEFPLAQERSAFCSTQAFS